MDLGLKGRNVLVTGGSRGIGLACAKGFIAEGARVAVVSRTKVNIENCFCINADLTDAAAAAAMVERVEKEFGALDVLVNSAGAAKRTDATDLNPAAWHAGMDAKYFSYIHVIDPVIKRMAARGRGVIVNVIGSGGRNPSPTHLAGGAANAALMLATAGLGNAFASKGVRVVGLNPGVTRTDRVAQGMAAEAKRSGISEEEALKKAIARLPLGRMAEPEEIANVVVFAASDRGSYLTGANIAMDGAASPSIL